MSDRPLLCFAARAGDRNDLAMAGARVLSELLAETFERQPKVIGAPRPALAGSWDEELTSARPDLVDLQDTIETALQGGVPVTVLNRCAAALATLPAVARQKPDASIVWFGAHGDCNVPNCSATGYLGGMVLSGAAGLWNSGLGSDLELANVILVGGRDLDPFERNLVSEGRLRLIEPGPNLPDRLEESLAGRSAYVHLDCDVLEPGLVPSEYQVPGGLSWDELQESCSVLVAAGVVGFEIAEYEAAWPDGRAGDLISLLSAIAPLNS